MTVKSTIFGGYNELELFKIVHSHWSDRFSLYPQIPFAQIFDFTNMNLTQQELQFLWKTNVDYTLCEKSGKPILCIEFDGMGHGISRHGKYIEIVQTRDPYRKQKLDLKLQVAQSNMFPFYVVSYDEKLTIGRAEHLTVVDGIIGRTLAVLKTPELLQQFLDEDENLINQLNQIERQERIQDILISAEVTAEMEYDLIAIKSAAMEGQLIKSNLYLGHANYHLEYPKLPDYDNMGKGFKERLLAWNHIQKFGCRCVVNTKLGEFSETAWVRNFEGSFALPLTIAENIANYLAFSKAVKAIG